MHFALSRSIALGVISLSLMSCAMIQGSVTPIEGGQYKSFASSDTKNEAMRIAASDARLTCKKDGNKNYIMISQEDKREGPAELKIGNTWLETAITMSKAGQEAKKNTQYEVTSVFKCVNSGS